MDGWRKVGRSDQEPGADNLLLDVADGQLGVVVVGIEFDDLAVMVHAARTIPQCGPKTTLHRRFKCRFQPFSGAEKIECVGIARIESQSCFGEHDRLPRQIAKLPDHDRINLIFDEEPNFSRFDLETIVRSQIPGVHFYCCGPAGLLTAFERATADLDPATIHIERFSAEQAPARGGFEVTLAKSRRSFRIPVDKTILEVLLSEGIEVNRSCMEGVCGTCETPVLEGIPDHRDSVLSKREREANKVMMICCSGSKTGKLVLDL